MNSLLQMEEDLTAWNKNGNVAFFLLRTTFMGYFLAETKANCIQIIDFGYVGAKDIEKILSNVCYFQLKAKRSEHCLSICRCSSRTVPNF